MIAEHKFDLFKRLNCVYGASVAFGLIYEHKRYSEAELRDAKRRHAAQVARARLTTKAKSSRPAAGRETGYQARGYVSY